MTIVLVVLRNSGSNEGTEMSLLTQACITASVDALCRDGAGQISHERVQNRSTAPAGATIYASEIQPQRPRASL